MTSRIFISSVQHEFTKERKALADYIRQDAICADWAIAAPEWIEDDEDFRVVLRRPLDVGATGGGGDSGDTQTTQQTTQPTTQQTTPNAVFPDRRAEKNREGGKGKSKDWETEESRDRNAGKRPAHGAKRAQGRERNDIPSRVRNTRKSRDRKSRSLIVALIGHFPNIKQAEIARAAGLSVKGVEKIIAQLKAEKVIDRVGGKRFEHWIVIAKKTEP